MHHTTTPIRKGFETTVLIENICQTALITEIDTVCSEILRIFIDFSSIIKEELYPDKQAIVTFRFRNRCEYVLEGSRLIFRSSNQTKGSGQVIRVLPQA